MSIAPESSYDSRKTRSPFDDRKRRSSDDEVDSIRLESVLQAAEERIWVALDAACEQPISGEAGSTLRAKAEAYADDDMAAYPASGSVAFTLQGLLCDGDEAGEIAGALEELARRIRRQERRKQNS
jgi:hypothetical protein